jgi:hypothetical protein
LFEQTLIAALLVNPSLSAVVGDRIFPTFKPQGEPNPLLVVLRVSTPRSHAFGTGSPVASSRPRFQFDSWCDTELAAAQLDEVVRAALQTLPYAVTFDNQFPHRDEMTGQHCHTTDAFIAHTGA